MSTGIRSAEGDALTVMYVVDNQRIDPTAK